MNNPLVTEVEQLVQSEVYTPLQVYTTEFPHQQTFSKLVTPIDTI